MIGVRLIVADVLDGLAELADESVHCVVTSPPYWGLRDYGTGSWAGGEDGCDHSVPYGSTTSTLEGGKATQESSRFYRDRCGRCGARRVDRQFGMEATPEEYVDRLVDVFRAVRRVLRRDGTVWLNLGDCYATGSSGQRVVGMNERLGRPVGAAKQGRGDRRRPAVAGMKPKDVVGIPWRVAFALQDDGWFLRAEIVWSKPNAMPESVRDRPTKSHEQVFLLARSRRYFYDPDAVREPFSDRSTPRPWNGNLTPYGEEVGKAAGLGGGSRGDPDLGRNMRSVWSVPTQPYPEAHFAPFPEELPRRCILAGCPPGGTVLDPFLGSGTTAKVARDLGRDAIGIELNPGYARLAEERNGQLTIYEGMALSS